MGNTARLVETSDFIASPLLKTCYRPFQPLVERWLGFSWVNNKYQRIKDLGAHDTESFCRICLEDFHVTVDSPTGITEQLRSIDGPAIVLSNHPYGGIDAFAVMKLMADSFGNDWKFVANKLLRNISEFDGVTLVVDPFAQGKEKQANLSAVKQMHQTLKQGKALGMFPAGRVSGKHSEFDIVCDLPWSNHALKLATQYNATIVLLNVSGHNSDTFLAIPPEQLLKRSLRLAKEIPLQTNKHITLSLSWIMNDSLIKKISHLSNSEQILQALDYIGSEKSQAQPAKSAQPDLTSIEQASSPQEESFSYLSELEQSATLLKQQGDFVSYFFQGRDCPETLTQIGKLREITFSQIGAGSGNEIDLSEEDQYYHHIVVLKQESQEVVGSYRVGLTQQIIEEHGSEQLYLNHIFSIDPSFYKKIGNAMELSRSFIVPHFQKNPQILDILWKSLGAVAQQYNCNSLYGSVTVSASFTPLSQSIIIDTLDRHHSADSELRDLITNDNPFTPTTQYHQLASDGFAPHGLNKLNDIIEDLEDNHRSIPPLVRYYVSLSAKFLSFKVEPTFGNAVYCLLLVKLDQIPPRFKKRFLGI